MKNKKSIAMAMAAVSTLGAVAPAFADNVESRILVGNESVDVRLASGYTLKTVEGKTVVAREKIYNYNGAPNDRSKHTLKNEFKDCKILIEKLGTTPNKDVFVLGEKVTDTVSVSQETAKLNALNSEIATYVANGYTKEEEKMINEKVMIGDQEYALTAVSMGNPHVITYVDSLDFDIETIGKQFEHHQIFPESVNTEFVEVINDHYLKMRVWERGSGETMACGTGACAVMYASYLNGYCKEKATVELLGGKLDIELQEGHIFMTGPATTVFEGKIKI